MSQHTPNNNESIAKIDDPLMISIENILFGIREECEKACSNLDNLFSNLKIRDDGHTKRLRLLNQEGNKGALVKRKDSNKEEKNIILCAALKEDNDQLHRENEDIIKEMIKMKEAHEELRYKFDYSERQNKILRKALDNKNNHDKKASASEKISLSTSCLKKRKQHHILQQHNLSHKKNKASSIHSHFMSLDDHVLIQIYEFTGRSFLTYGFLNKRCYELYKIYGIPKQSSLFGYAPMSMIIHKLDNPVDKNRTDVNIAKGILYYKRKDVLEWTLSREEQEEKRLIIISRVAALEGNLSILSQIFENSRKEIRRGIRERGGICYYAALKGRLKILKWLRDHDCVWGENLNKIGEMAITNRCVIEWLKVNGCPWFS